MTKTVFVQIPEGGSQCLQISDIDDLCTQIEQRCNIPAEYQNYHSGGRLLKEIKELMTITLYLKLEGGKGGFGSLLRNQAQTRRKITNWDHSRDRQGRRIGNVKNENKLIDYFKKKKEEEIKIQQEVQQVKIMQDTMKQNQFDIKLDQSYKNKIEQSEQLIGESMKKVKKEEKCERKKNKITKNILNMIDEAIEEQQE